MKDTYEKPRWDVHIGDKLFQVVLRVFACSIIGILILFAWELLAESRPAIEKFGFWNFLTSREWDPGNEVFGGLSFIYGTMVSSVLAITIAGPVSVGIALFLTELLPKKMASPFSYLIEMLAAIPSVVYGLWGIFVLAPWMRETVQPKLGSVFGFLPFFQGPAYGVGLGTSGLILAIMILPTITSVCREVFTAVAVDQREAALALGATRWEMIRISVLSSTRTGIMAAMILGLGRALGETMAVTMVIGNRPEISASLFSPGATMASVIANQYAEATSDIHVSSLVYVGFTLFLVSFFINALARLVVWREMRAK